MPKLKLTYFDFDGGRGEPARLALRIGGVAFEDHRIPGAEWPKHRDQMPFRAMPVLEVDGKGITQSNSINRYVGKLTGLYPKDDWQALRADEVMDAAKDIGTRIGATINVPDDVKKKTREELAAGHITRYLEQFRSEERRVGKECRSRWS